MSLRPSPGLAAAEPDRRHDRYPDVGQATVGGAADARLDTRYEQLRDAALHARGRAFPLGLGVLIGKGVATWRRVMTHLAQPHGSDAVPVLRPESAAHGQAAGRCPLPAALTSELINVLAAVALGGTTGAPAPP